MREKKPNKNEFPTDPFIRSYLRWAWLFNGTLRALYKRDHKLTRGLLESYKQFGLIKEMFGLGLPYWRDLYEPNPSDEMLQKTKYFSESAFIPNMKGKKVRWGEEITKLLNRIDGVSSFIAYSSILSELKKLPRVWRNPEARLKSIREHLPTIIDKVHFKKGKIIPDPILRDWIVKSELPPGELAKRIVAHLHGKKPDAFQKYLSEGKKRINLYLKTPK